MKHLYLIRHAKSDWSDESKNDFDRGLNSRGKKAIFIMADALKHKQVMPDLILSSSAKRAKLTAKGLAKEIGYRGKIKYRDDLYMAEPETVQSIIQEVKKKYNSIFVVGHNPETTELVDLMTGEYIYNVPTLGIVGIELPIKEWIDLKPNEGKMKFFIYPKMFKSH